MTETVLGSLDEAARLFEHVPPRPLEFVPACDAAGGESPGWASRSRDDEIEYLRERLPRSSGAIRPTPS